MRHADAHLRKTCGSPKSKGALVTTRASENNMNTMIIEWSGTLACAALFALGFAVTIF